MDIDLNNYICSIPFRELEIQNPRKMLCCASWLKLWLPENLSAKEAWHSDEANSIRKSVLDGTFKYCDKGECPFLANVISTKRVSSPIFHKQNIPNHIQGLINKFQNNIEITPYTLQFSFDSTCNLKCPSCRNDLIVENSKGIDRVRRQIEILKEDFGKTTKRIYITGTGDPFVSVGFREFLKNFKKTDWPSLNRIHLHTNATKWDKKMWDSMKEVHSLIKTCEISIDAATKETYENKVRLGGNWDELIENLKFISTIPTLSIIKTSFVVQKDNYKEMKDFYELMISIFGKKVNVYFGKILNWGNLSNDTYNDKKVWEPSHPQYDDFVEEVNSFILKDKVWHNLQEFVKPTRSLI